VTTDADYPESESIDEEKLEQHKVISEVMKKNQERSWSFWEAVIIYNSRRLTPAGKDAVRWAKDRLQCTLGDDFLQKAAEAPSPHPIFDLDLWPAYDLPQAYANLFQLVAEIELLQSKEGWSIVHDSLRRDFQREPWGSTLLQLEVAGLGLKAGWYIPRDAQRAALSNLYIWEFSNVQLMHTRASYQVDKTVQIVYT